MSARHNVSVPMQTVPSVPSLESVGRYIRLREVMLDDMFLIHEGVSSYPFYSDQWMVDIHDRHHVVLSAEHAREWVDPNASPLRASELAWQCCRKVGTSAGIRLVRRWKTCGIRGQN